MQKFNLPDWAIRAIKTFIQAFFGLFIPALATYLANGFPEALSAAISAAWNIILEHLEEK